MHKALLGLGAFPLIVACSTSGSLEPDSMTPMPTLLIIGHRGASGYLPEHTLASYERAIEQGADFIEPDLVSTRDGVLVVRHENEISGTTDVAKKFPKRKTKKVVDGQEIEGWFTEDFTLEELKTLRATQRVSFRDQSKNGLYEIPTFQEVIDLVKKRSQELGRPIGIYPETKHPSYFDAIGLSLEEPLVKTLRANGLNHRDAPVFIQSFEVSNLRALSSMTEVRLIQLLDESNKKPFDFELKKDPRTYGDLMKPEGLAEISGYAAGIGPYKRSIVPEGPSKKLLKPTTLIADAHKAGLLVHPYTFRNEAVYLAPEYKGDPVAEYLEFFKLGVDGVFSDFPDVAVKARELFSKNASK